MDKQLFLVLLLSSLASVWAGGARCSSPAAPDSDVSAVRNVPIIDSGASFSEYFSIFDSEMDGQGWMFQESVCPYRAVACTQASGQDNWIVTMRMPQVVQQTTLTSILVLVNYTTNCTNLPCDSDALGLYILRTAEDSTNFASYEVVSMTIPNNVPVEVPLTGLTDGYVLGIRDNGTCATLFRVQVYYSACDVPFTAAGITGIATGGSTVVNCASNSVSSSVSTSCSAEGVLSPSVPCQCAAGFSGADGMTCAACTSDTYKSVTGSSDCLPCPMFSEVTSTSANCSCVIGHIRADPSDITADCDMCDSGYFLSGAAETLGQCLSCPAGSASPGGTQSSCTCNTGLVTDTQVTTTTSDACNLCAENYFSTPCMMCPADSVRSFSDDKNSCSCTEGRAVTPLGDTITTGNVCNDCVRSHYLNGGSCMMCPSNSEQSSNPAMCSCLDNHVTSNEMTTTTTEQCSGCASTHYLSSGSCLPCPEFSTTRVVSDSTCQCQDGYAFNDGTQMSTSANCIVILGFIANNVTLMEGSTTRPIGVSVRAGGSIDMEIVLQSTLTPNDVVVDILPGNVIFNNANEVPAPIIIMGNQLALDSYPSTYTFTITDSSAYIAGGMINGMQVYSELVLTLIDDDTVAVGFTQPTVQFNETEGKGVVTVSKVGGTSSSFTLRLTTTTETNNALNVSGVIEFPASDEDAVDNFEFDIINDNSGASASRSIEFLLEFMGPPEFKDDVLFDQSNLFRTVTVIIINDDPPPTSSPLALNTIIGICVGAALVALLIFIIFILVVCICRLRSINRQGFYTTHEDQTKEPPTMLRYSASLRSISSQTVVPVENTQGTVTKENEFYV